MFKSRQFVAILVVVFIGGMLYYSANIIWPQQAVLLFAPANNPILTGVYQNIFNFGTILSATIVLTIVPFLGYERWQLIGLLTVQVILIGCMGVIGVHDKAPAIAMILLISCTIAPINFLCFGMASLGLEDQSDM